MTLRRRTVNALLIGAGVLAGLVVALWVGGSLLPRDHLSQTALELRADRERVWALISDVGGTGRWRPEVRKIEMQPAVAGRVRFVETTGQGDTPFEVVSQEPPARQVIRVVDDGLPFGGTWTWELTPTGAGTRVTISEAGFIRNPVFRVASRVFFPPTKMMQGYLRALARELGESAEPVLVRER
ncbi:MAG TPA: SRPBCC domain-containing protein [Gemmatimonadales bacterium]|nr:SRPBCC domain-containing protein [Gemmatimonadales bacterium]